MTAPLITGEVAVTYDVFISYSSRDKAVAFAVCEGLERRGRKCWIAPRDVLPGTSYEEAIIQAINACRVFVLIFTADSNNSPHVENEVRIAWTRDMPIVSFRVEDVPLSDIMNYYLGSRQWLDAGRPPVEKDIEMLADDIEKLAGQHKTPANGHPMDHTAAHEASPAAGREDLAPRAARKVSPFPLAVLALAVIVILLVAAVYVLGTRATPGTGPNGTPTPVADQTLLLVPPGSVAVPTPDLPANLSGYQIRVIGGLKPDITVTMDDMRKMSFVRIENVEKSLLNGNSYMADYTGVPAMAVVNLAGVPQGNVSFRVISEDDFGVTFTTRQLEYTIVAFFQGDELNEADIDSKKAIKLVPMGIPAAEFWVKMPKEIRIYQS
jgi:hypothetical protein